MTYYSKDAVDIPDNVEIDDEWLSCTGRTYLAGWNIWCNVVPGRPAGVFVGFWEGAEPEIAFRAMMIERGGYRTPKEILILPSQFAAVPVRKSKLWRVFLSHCDVFEVKAENSLEAYTTMRRRISLEDWGGPAYLVIEGERVHAIWEPPKGDSGETGPIILDMHRIHGDTDYPLCIGLRDEGGIRCAACDIHIEKGVGDSYKIETTARNLFECLVCQDCARHYNDSTDDGEDVGGACTNPNELYDFTYTDKDGEKTLVFEDDVCLSEQNPPGWNIIQAVPDEDDDPHKSADWDDSPKPVPDTMKGRPLGSPNKYAGDPEGSGYDNLPHPKKGSDS